MHPIPEMLDRDYAYKYLLATGVAYHDEIRRTVILLDQRYKLIR